MTMILSSLTPHGGVVISDSRVSWGHERTAKRQDVLQKAIVLSPNAIIAYSGDVKVASDVITELSKLITQDKRRGQLETLASNLARTAKHFYSENQKKTRQDNGLSFLLSGINKDGIVQSWWLQHPSYQLNELSPNEIKVLGSGAVTSNQLERDHRKVLSTATSLKSYADDIYRHAESELRKHDGVHDSVGGMLQVWLISNDGITPLNHAFMDLIPDGTGDAKSMSFENNEWVQRDHRKKEYLKAGHPSSIFLSGPQEKRIQDFAKVVPRKLKWNLNHFITFTKMELGHGVTRFYGVATQFGNFSYPTELPYPLVWAGLAFRGPIGKRKIRIDVVTDTNRQELLRDTVQIRDPFEGFEYYAPLKLEIEVSGQVFLECFIDDEFLGRRSLFFGIVPSGLTLMNENGDKISNFLVEQHRSLNDATLDGSHPAEVVYFHVCQKSEAAGTFLSFENQFNAVYWKKYPFPLQVNIASSFRMASGDHQITLKLINAASRDEHVIATKQVKAGSSTIAVPVHGDIMINIPEPGIYFVNAYVDDKFVTSDIFIAEDTKPRYSYDLFDEQINDLEAGNDYLMILRRSYKAGESWDQNIKVVQPK